MLYKRISEITVFKTHDFKKQFFLLNKTKITERRNIIVRKHKKVFF